jgi:hypothetical protein
LFLSSQSSGGSPSGIGAPVPTIPELSSHKKYSDDLIETIDLYDELEVMIKIVRPDLDDLEFMGGSYELNQSNINYFEKKLGRKFVPWR